MYMFRNQSEIYQVTNARLRCYNLPLRVIHLAQLCRRFPTLPRSRLSDRICMVQTLT